MKILVILCIQDANYSTRGMLETTLNASYYTAYRRDAGETTLDANHFTGGMLEITLNAHFSTLNPAQSALNPAQSALNPA